ncbi:MAG: galactokinase [Pseudonocardiaceae bacterium]|nr:galactokinase [Pseudonocardiaceae bacterium]
MTMSFRAAFGREPDGRWAAPGRVNLIGEHVDYAAGLCLPLALPQRTVVAAARRDDGRVRLRSTSEQAGWDGPLEEIGRGTPEGWAGYAAGVLWALRAAGHPVCGIDLLVGDSVPPGAGLSSSAALECAVAVAVDELAGLGLAGTDAGRALLATACQRAENEVVGAPTGGMDQAAALRCTARHVLLLDCLDWSAQQVPLDLTAAGLTLLVIDTRVRHQLADGQYGRRRDSVERAAAALGVAALREASPDDLATLHDPVQRRRARHVVTEIARVREVADLLRQRRVREIGPLLDASHASLRDDYEVSCAELDTAVTAARQAGALGARMTGGGFGGSAIALVTSDAADRVADSVRAAFERAGHREPSFLLAVPSPGAGRLD